MNFRLKILVLLLMNALLSACVFFTKHCDYKNIYLGDRLVKIVREDYGPGKVFVHLHANESTALKAARRVARSQGGQVITLVHASTRDIEFHYHGRFYAFDPNRIYTRQGIIETLKKHHCYRKEVIPMIERFARQVLLTIPSGKIVAVHNNQDYSLLDYLPAHSLSHDAHALYYSKNISYRNFYLVTQTKDFKRYRSMGFNVIQQAFHAKDDGSLSIAMKHRNYVNVEAGYHELRPQMQMLKLA
ncbi:MAG: hypothetical protein QG556_330 [Pseudomonadota bacterium]|nr:hypothetical protein [Pseudomonadota bacterium]